MNLLKRAGCLAALLMLLGMGGAFAQQPVVGRDYTLISPPQPTAGGKAIEVLEFFWYGCLHCYNLEPSLQAWLKRKPADVEFRPVPAASVVVAPAGPRFYALEAMGVPPNNTEIFRNPATSKGAARFARAGHWLGGKGLENRSFSTPTIPSR